MIVLVELTPLDTLGGSRVTLRATSANSRQVTAVNDERWWPAIKDTPTLNLQLFDGDFSTDTSVGTAAFTVLTDKLARLDANARRYHWAGAGVTIYAGNAGDAWPWTTWFSGLVDSFEAQANALKITAKVSTDAFDKPALTLTYAGTGGIEGGTDLSGKPKPWLLGRALNVEPVLIDATNSVFQFSAYGAIQAVNVLYERASDFGASIDDYANYTALVAATIPPGRWGTCLASGLVRLGAPPAGVITGDVDGDKPGGTWIRTTGAIINRIAINAGVSPGLIDSASLSALDAAVPYHINLYQSDQITVLDLARQLARPCNAQAAVSWLGKLFVTRVAIGSPGLTLDAQGRQKPGVTGSTESDVSAPYWRIEMGAQRSWRVHTLDEIAFADTLTNRGAYDSATWYKGGDIVTYQGSSWIYVGTPGSGNVPPTLPTTTNGFWESMAEAGNQPSLIFMRSAARPATPTGDNPTGWTPGVPSGTDTLWESAGTKNQAGNIIGSWSAPNAITSLAPRGAYSGATTYYLNNVATYNGGSYIALQDNFSGQAPTGTAQANAYWGVIAAPGDTGAPATPPSGFSATIALTSGAAINLRSVADANGYTGHSDATITYNVPNGVTIRGLAGGGIGIDSGSWPSGYTIALTLVVQSGGIVDGGGGSGGDASLGTGGAGGDAIYCRVDLSGGVTINSGGTVRGGGGGGGGGHGEFNTPPGQFRSPSDPYDGGGGGGGGAPNGGGGLGEIGQNGGTSGSDGSAGTTGGGGAGGSGFQAGGAGGGFATAGTAAAGASGAAGYAVRKNGFSVAVTNSGTMTGTAA